MEKKLNSSFKIIGSLLIALLIMISLMIPAYALKEYKISFKSGSKGIYQDGSTSKNLMVEMGQDLSIAPDTLAADLKIEEGYYFNGWNYTVKQTGITKSANYVAQYKRIIDEAVYRVRYIDDFGNELATQKVVTSNVGIVVAENAINIDGYAADMLTKTATVDKKGTEITFIYVSTASGEIETITQHDVVIVAGGNASRPGQDNMGNNNIDAGTSEGNDINGNMAGGNEAQGTEEIPEEKTPLAKKGDNKSDNDYAMLMGIGLIIIAIAAGTAYVIKTKKS